jgi:hypothetical protein
MVDQTEQLFNTCSEVTSAFKRFDVGLTGGIGLSQGIGYGDIFLDVLGGYGLTAIQKIFRKGIATMSIYL